MSDLNHGFGWGWGGSLGFRSVALGSSRRTREEHGMADKGPYHTQNGMHMEPPLGKRMCLRGCVGVCVCVYECGPGTHIQKPEIKESFLRDPRG